MYSRRYGAFELKFIEQGSRTPDFGRDSHYKKKIEKIKIFPSYAKKVRISCVMN